MGSTKVVICGVDTSKIPRIKEKQMQEFMQRIKQGDMVAKQEFIYYNYRLVLSITHRFNAKNNNIDDIFQVGVIGLIKAINNFNPSYNLKFSTYAVPMICGEIKRYLRDNSFLRVSRSLKDIAYQALKAKEAFYKKNGFEPSLEEVSVLLNIPPNVLFLAVESGNEPVSLYEKVYDKSGNKVSLLDEIKDPNESLDKQIEMISLKSALQKLDDREKDVISRRYFEGKTQVEVSDEIGISQAQVSRIEKNALKSLQLNL